MMSLPQSILVVVQDKQEAQTLLAKARALTAQTSASIHAVRIVYEGVADLKTKQIEGSSELKSFILASEETYLEQALEESGEEIAGIESATLWNQHTWVGVLHAAENVNAELIIKIGGATSNVAAMIHTPDDWHLLRQASMPVLITTMRPWPSRPSVVAAVDVFDERHQALNERIAQTAASTAAQLGAELHFLGTYPLLEPWATELGAASSYVSVKAEIDKDVFAHIAQLAEDAGISDLQEDYQAHSAEGPTVAAIRNALESIGGTILVVGTKARSGIEGVFLGNTAEKLLHQATTDVLTVP